MAKTILVAGYTKQKNINLIRSFFPADEVTVVCAFARQPLSEVKQSYLRLFDALYDLSKEEDVERLSKSAETIDCITCTQERDMSAYIKALLICGKITEEQSQKYADSINKNKFKSSLGTAHPELVPSCKVITTDLLENLDSLTYPQVIKPDGLAGSIMTRVVNSAEELTEHYHNFSDKMLEIANNHYDKEIEIITEDFVEGPQYSVNAFIDAAGEIILCPVVRVITPLELGINDTYSVFQYTTDELPTETIESLKIAVQKIVAHFDIKNTSAHFDSVLDNGNWKFFEVGLRFGGHRQKLYELSQQMNTLRNDICNRLGLGVSIKPQKTNVCIVQKAAEEQGVLESISYERIIKHEKAPLILEDKMSKIGSEVMPVALGGGTVTRHFVVGKELDNVLDVSKELFHSIKFHLKR